VKEGDGLLLGVCEGVGRLLGVFEAVFVKEGVSVLEAVIDCVSPDDDATKRASVHKTYITAVLGDQENS